MTAPDDDPARVRPGSRSADWWYFPANAATLATLAVVPGLGDATQMFFVAALGCVMITTFAELRRMQIGMVAGVTWEPRAVAAAVVFGAVALGHLGASMLMVRLGAQDWIPVVFLSAFATSWLGIFVLERAASSIGAEVGADPR
ncbi:hypothetical protein [Mycetocola zhadangensis]|uniref:Uncharacterized protein n=1 Tax=Mycetocola zhadangensis TaxID=1164595 RepID=A0A3L7IWE0_9MICO|nr:hypothetical protein [Mycetocola zhadangensis]RLQ82517.1 hypothetical protein D9V28_11120 [Mycetocola zhadangensis]GGF00568.1 hypothetical protein GCM10011313_24510 [Mycetocola zhadangensis]